MGKKAADPAEQAAYDAVMKKLGLAKPASSAEAEAAPVAKRCKVDPGSSQEPQQQKEKKPAAEGKEKTRAKAQGQRRAAKKEAR